MSDAVSELQCWQCGTDISSLPRPISRQATCPGCFHELHCCEMCLHYTPRSTTDCAEDQADPPQRKDSANFCEFFSPAAAAHRESGASKADEARRKLDDLFG